MRMVRAYPDFGLEGNDNVERSEASVALTEEVARS